MLLDFEKRKHRLGSNDEIARCSLLKTRRRKIGSPDRFGISQKQKSKGHVIACVFWSQVEAHATVLSHHDRTIMVSFTRSQEITVEAPNVRIIDNGFPAYSAISRNHYTPQVIDTVFCLPVSSDTHSPSTIRILWSCFDGVPTARLHSCCSRS